MCEIGQDFIQMKIFTQLIWNKSTEPTMVKACMAEMLLAYGSVGATKGFYPLPHRGCLK